MQVQQLSLWKVTDHARKLENSLCLPVVRACVCVRACARPRVCVCVYVCVYVFATSFTLIRQIVPTVNIDQLSRVVVCCKLIFNQIINKSHEVRHVVGILCRSFNIDCANIVFIYTIK